MADPSTGRRRPGTLHDRCQVDRCAEVSADKPFDGLEPIADGGSRGRRRVESPRLPGRIDPPTARV
jgi:hypothetical protein